MIKTTLVVLLAVYANARQVDGQLGGAIAAGAQIDPVAAAGNVAPVAVDGATGTLIDTSNGVIKTAAIANGIIKNATSNVLAVNVAVQEEVRKALANLLVAADELQKNGQVAVGGGGAIGGAAPVPAGPAGPAPAGGVAGAGGVAVAAPGAAAGGSAGGAAAAGAPTTTGATSTTTTAKP